MDYQTKKIKQKILITGSSGKIGKNLIGHLVNRQNLSIRVILREKTGFFQSPVEVAIADLLNKDSLFRAFKDVETVVHLAGLTHAQNKEDYYRINIGGAENVVEAAKRTGVKKIIFVSTRAIDKAAGAYGWSKLLAEEIIKNSGLGWIILRSAEVYGVGKGEMIDQLIKFIKKSPVVPVIKTNKILSPLHISDLINALERAILNNKLDEKTYTLAGPEDFTFEELIDSICFFHKLKRFKIYCPVWLMKIFFKTLSMIPFTKLIVSDQLDRLLSHKSSDIKEARRDLGFNPKKFQDGLLLFK